MLPAIGMVVLVALPADSSDWSNVAERVRKSIMLVETTKGTCTGFVINSNRKNKDDEDVDLILTAAHCDGPELRADQRPAKILHKDDRKDLMVLEVEDTERPVLFIAKDNPKKAQQVMSYGFGYGLERPMLRFTSIADDNTYIPEGGIGGPLFVTDAGLVAGQSGGPIVNERGEVVMIVQMSSGVVGLGVGAEMIRDKVGRYLEKPKVP